MRVTDRSGHRAPSRWLRACLGLALSGCAAPPEATDGPTPPDLSASLAPDLAPPEGPCARLHLPVRPFSTGTSGVQRDELAGDFTLTDQGGAYHFQEAWSGCESYVFLPDGMPVSSADSTPMWSSDLDALLAASPPNVHYFFVSRKATPAAAKASVAQVSAQLDAALAGLPDGADPLVPGSRPWWRQHLHFVDGTAKSIGGWLGAELAASSTHVGFGLAIDRAQRIRGLGSLADVTRADNSIPGWPFQNNLAYAANPPVYFNYEADREAALASEQGAQVITVYDHEVVVATAPDGGVPDGGAPVTPGTVERDVVFPDAATMQGFDRLEVDLEMGCPDHTMPEEANNCGAWDYIVNIEFLDADGSTYREAARFISSYHRAGRYLVDATHFLPYLATGGAHHMRYMWAPPWNEQPADTVLRFRLSRSGGALRPTQAIFLHGGGNFDASYDPRVPVDAAIPAGAKKVELRAILTGHGGAAHNCAEFCDHAHEFTIGSRRYTKDFPEVADPQGCMARVGAGAVPNQSGTWWYGRGGWCPGMQVDPWVVDVTDAAPAGQTVSVGYRGLFQGKPPTSGLGNIVLSSWLLVWE